MSVYTYKPFNYMVVDEEGNDVCSFFDCDLDDKEIDVLGPKVAKQLTLFPAAIEQLKNAVSLWGSRCTDESQQLWLNLVNQIIKESEGT